MKNRWYYFLKVLHFTKVFTKDDNLLRLRTTRFAIEFISFESFIHHETDLKIMCTTNKWCEFNKYKSKKSLRNNVSNFILIDWLWKQVMKVQTIMKHNSWSRKKLILSIIYEAIDRIKISISFLGLIILFFNARWKNFCVICYRG